MEFEKNQDEEIILKTHSTEEINDDEHSHVDPEWFSDSPKGKRTFGYNWKNGFVSPFRSTDLSSLVSFFEDIQKLDFFPHCTDPTEHYFVDLGCGNGKTNIEIALKFGFPGLGIDLDDALIAEAQKLCQESKVEHLVDFRAQSFHSPINFTKPPTIIYAYLLPEALEGLKTLIHQWLTTYPNIIFVSCMWPLPPTWFEDNLIYTYKNGLFRVYANKQGQLNT